MVDPVPEHEKRNWRRTSHVGHFPGILALPYFLDFFAPAVLEIEAGYLQDYPFLKHTWKWIFRDPGK